MKEGENREGAAPGITEMKVEGTEGQWTAGGGPAQLGLAHLCISHCSDIEILIVRSGGVQTFSPRATYRKLYGGLGHSLEVYCLINSVIILTKIC